MLSGDVSLCDLRVFFALLELRHVRELHVRMGRWKDVSLHVDIADVIGLGVLHLTAEKIRQCISHLRSAHLIGARGRELDWPDPHEIDDDKLDAFMQRADCGDRAFPMLRTLIGHLARRKGSRRAVCGLLPLCMTVFAFPGERRRHKGRISAAHWGKVLDTPRKAVAGGLAYWESKGLIETIARGIHGARVFVWAMDWKEPPPLIRARPVENRTGKGPTQMGAEAAAAVAVPENGQVEGGGCTGKRPALALVFNCPTDRYEAHNGAARLRSAPPARPWMEKEGASGAVIEARTTRGVLIVGVQLENLTNGAYLDRVARRLVDERGWARDAARDFTWRAARRARSRPLQHRCGRFATLMLAGEGRFTYEHERDAKRARLEHDERSSNRSVIAAILPRLPLAEPPRSRESDQVDEGLSNRAQVLKRFRGLYAAQKASAELAALTREQRANEFLAKEAAARGRSLGEQQANAAFAKAFTQVGYRNAARELAVFTATNESGEAGWGVSAAPTATLEAPRVNNELPATAADSTRHGDAWHSHEAEALPIGAIPDEDAPSTPRRRIGVAAAFESVPFASTFFPAGVPVWMPRPYIEPAGGTFTPNRALNYAEFCSTFGILTEGGVAVVPALRMATETTLMTFKTGDALAGL